MNSRPGDVRPAVRKKHEIYAASFPKRASLSAKLTAILDFAVPITKSPLDCLESDLQHLRSLGLTEYEVWDVIEIAAMYNFTNRMSQATGMLPNREYHALARGPK